MNNEQYRNAEKILRFKIIHYSLFTLHYSLSREASKELRTARQKTRPELYARDGIAAARPRLAEAVGFEPTSP